MTVARYFDPRSVHYTPEDLAVCQKALDAIAQHSLCGERELANCAEIILELYRQGITDSNKLARLTMEVRGSKTPLRAH